MTSSGDKDREVWRRYWTFWYEQRQQEADAAKRLAEEYGETFPASSCAAREERVMSLACKVADLRYGDLCPRCNAASGIDSCPWGDGDKCPIDVDPLPANYYEPRSAVPESGQRYPHPAPDASEPAVPNGQAFTLSASAATEAVTLAEQWKGRADDCGRLARAVLRDKQIGRGSGSARAIGMMKQNDIEGLKIAVAALFEALEWDEQQLMEKFIMNRKGKIVYGLDESDARRALEILRGID